METKQIAILIITGVISITGIIVNIFKKNQKQDIFVLNDNHSLLLFRICIPLTLISSIFLYLFSSFKINIDPILLFLSYTLIFVGYFIRLFAILSLGNYFTVNITISMDHKLKTNGIYKKIRHPSYTGLILYYTGLGIAMENYICIIILFVIPLMVVLYRIKNEEKVLQQHFSLSYNEYKKQSYKLFPFIY